MSIKVAVRVRPLNSREIRLGSEICVDMSGNTTTLVDPKGRKRDFAYDYSFWSLDGYEEEDNGVLKGTGDKYADQDYVYNTIGRDMLENAWKGYHCCLFAYGQTGSGKSYSIIGYGPNKGIVPMMGENLFQKIEGSDDGVKREVNLSMIELYNEKVFDLMMPSNKRTSSGLKIRENSTVGVYVEGLSKWPVLSYKDIEKKIDDGNKNKTIAATAMNADSSRAHTIVQIELRQYTTLEGGKKSGKLSVIFLVDLAGSERVGKTQVGAKDTDRLKEACSINKSLSALGIVISALAENQGKKKKGIIPYRSSVLTRILKNALGGNSMTSMLCAISPSMDNYSETLSTLRYADQAKKIKCKPIVNESASDKLIRELKEENERLKNQLSQLNSGVGGSANNHLKQEMQDQVESNQNLISGMMMSFEDRIKEMREKMVNDDDMYDYSAPNLVNVNEDPLLDGKIFFNLLAVPILYIGRKNSKPKPHVVLNGAGIQKRHARIMNNEGRIFVLPQNSKSKLIYVNGNKVSQKTELKHLDRLVFGSSSFFLFRYPGYEAESNTKGVKEKELDWDFYMNELSSNNSEFSSNATKDMEKEESSMKNRYEAEKVSIENEMQKQKEEFEKKLVDLQIQLQSGEGSSANGDQELEKLELQKVETQKNFKKERAKMKAQQMRSRKRQNIRRMLFRKLEQLCSMVNETNIIAQELSRNIHVEVELSPEFFVEVEEPTDCLRIKVINSEKNSVYLWDTDKFQDRYFLIKEIVSNMVLEDSMVSTTTEEDESDPFWDPAGPIDIGRGYIPLKHAAYRFALKRPVTFVSENQPIGTVQVSIEPCQQDGSPFSAEDLKSLTDPMALVNQQFSMRVSIGAAELNSLYTKKKVFIRFFVEETDDMGAIEVFQTQQTSSEDGKVDFAYSEVLNFSEVSNNFMITLMSQKLRLQLHSLVNMEDLSLLPQREEFWGYQQITLIRRPKTRAP